jgi:molybdopterin/thiamine biosynthesis adenylyltransferase
VNILDALNRTFLLMRSDLKAGVGDERLLNALRSTRVVLAADKAVLSTHSGQSAFIATATTMARSGHSIWFAAPDAELIGPQPPLQGEWLLKALHEISRDLLPDWEFEQGESPAADLAIVFGSPEIPIDAAIILHANATDWACRVRNEPAGEWQGGEWPLGGLAAAAVAAGEAFKTAMRKLRGEAVSPALFDELYAPLQKVQVELAPDNTPKVADLGCFDFVSAGAIGNAALHVLFRAPSVSGNCRIIDHDISALTNLNRNALLRRSRLGVPKVEDIASYATGLTIEPVPHRFGGDGEPPIELRDVVLVGVDHIPSRWAVQREHPAWLGIAGTEGYSVQLSWHQEGLACARCVHPTNIDRNSEIATAGFVSYWAGLLLATAFLRQRSGVPRPLDQQAAFLSTLRPESWAIAYSTVNRLDECPDCAAARRAA